MPLLKGDFSDKQRRFLELYIDKQFNITVICQEVGISRQAYYAWKEDEDFQQAIRDLRMFMVDKAEEVLLHSLGRNNPNVAMFVLGKLHPDYKDRIDVTSNGQTVGQTNIINIIVRNDQEDGITEDQ